MDPAPPAPGQTPADTSEEYSEVYYERAWQQHLTRRERIRQFAPIMINAISAAVLAYAEPLYGNPSYHTSALLGEEWVQELLNGHPERIHCELGVHKHVFKGLIMALEYCGLGASHHTSLEEKLAIFLYTCVTGLSVRHVGEHFQHSNRTILKYFAKVLVAFSSAPFYTQHGVIGVIDGTHINCAPLVAEQEVSCNWKGRVTQNCLAACSFDMQFLYMDNGWEGLVADSMMYNDTLLSNLAIPNDKYYLPDTSFPVCTSLLVPYQGMHYHLAEWGHADMRPSNAQELFNLSHSSVQNAVECIFGVLKCWFRILILPPEFDLNTQACLPPALAAVHNFIRVHDPLELEEFNDLLVDQQPGENIGQLAEGPSHTAKRNETHAKCDWIAQQMWAQYQATIHTRVTEG